MRGRDPAEDVVAERDLPPFDRVCMDGIAVDSEALRRGVGRFVVQATQAAGSPALELERTDHAIEVMTGAILPRATDCVVPVEQYSIASGIVGFATPQKVRFRRYQEKWRSCP